MGCYLSLGSSQAQWEAEFCPSSLETVKFLTLKKIPNQQHSSVQFKSSLHFSIKQNFTIIFEKLSQHLKFVFSTVNSCICCF